MSSTTRMRTRFQPALATAPVEVAYADESPNAEAEQLLALLVAQSATPVPTQYQAARAVRRGQAPKASCKPLSFDDAPELPAPRPAPHPSTQRFRTVALPQVPQPPYTPPVQQRASFGAATSFTPPVQARQPTSKLPATLSAHPSAHPLTYQEHEWEPAPQVYFIQAPNNGLSFGRLVQLIIIAAVSLWIINALGVNIHLPLSGRGFMAVPAVSAASSAQVAPAVAQANAPAASVPAVATASDELRRAPSISAAKIDAILTAYGSPAAGTGQAWIAQGEKWGIDPAFAVAFFIHESSAGTNPYWAGFKPDGSTTHNVGNIICAGYATCYGRFRDYATWDEGIGDWYKLIGTEYIEGRGTTTVSQIIPIYAPSFENDVQAYIDSVMGLVQQWRAEAATM